MKQQRSTTPPECKAESYTIEHHTTHPVFKTEGNWYRLRLNYSERQWGNGGVKKIKTQLSLYEERERVERYVARFHPDLPEVPE